MCLNPITISTVNDRFDRPSRTLRYLNAVPTSLLSQTAPYLYRKVSVPCGKCIQCLKKRQNDIACRAAREAAKRGSMIFCTLTYSNKYLPLSCCLEFVDSDTGEIDRPYPSEVLERSEFTEKCLDHILSVKPGKKPRYYSYVNDFTKMFQYDNIEVRYCVTPSLNRRDVRLWLKRCRVNYKREFGKDCPDFSYILCGEMGPRTSRPHYHICFMGLSEKDCRWFLSLWHYGFTHCRKVNAVNEDGSNGYINASRYIAKYITKGRFECDSVKCKYAEKPRLCISKHFGSDIDDNLISYYRCYDIYGKYDINSLKLDNGVKLSDLQINVLVDNIRQRSSFVVNGYKFPIPKSLIYKIWYVKQADSSLVSSTFRIIYSFVTQSKYLDSFNTVFRLYYSSRSERSVADVLSEFVCMQEVSSASQDSFDESSLQRFYNSSIF